MKQFSLTTLTIAFIALMFLLPYGAAGQNTWYANPNGDDVTGDGSQGDPWRTLYAAYWNNSVLAGDTIRVGGDSDSSSIDEELSLSIGKKGLVIDGDPDVGVLPHFSFSSSSYTININADSVLLRGIRVSSTSAANVYAIGVPGRDHVRIENCIIGGSEETNATRAMYIDNADSIVITNTLIRNTDEYGLEIRQSHYGRYENIVFSNALGSGTYSYFFGSASPASSNNWFEGNVITGAAYGIYIDGDATGNTFVRNEISGSNAAVSYDADSYDNRMYLNTISSAVFSSSTGGNLWLSDRMHIYQHDGETTLSGYLGNYYSSGSHTDADDDGIADAGFNLPGEEPTDVHALAVTADNYTLEEGQVLTVTQITGSIAPGGTDKAVLKALLVASGTSYLGTVEAFAISTTGTSQTSDILTARVFDTGSNESFATDSQFGSDANSPGSGATISGSRELVEGANVFWVTYDLSASTSAGNAFDAALSSVTVEGETLLPEVTSPAGVRTAVVLDSLPGYALDFDGSSSYLDLGLDPSSISGVSSITVEMWVNVGTFVDAERVMEKEDEWYLYLGTDDIRFTVHGATGSPNYVSTGTLSAGQWYHVAATYSSTLDEFRIYVNGALKGSKSWSGGIQNSTYHLTLGARRSAGGSATGFLEGAIDEVRIWNIARTQDEIRTDMYATIKGLDDGLVAYWQFNEGSGSSAEDHWGGVDGTLVASPTWLTSELPVGGVSSASATVASAAANAVVGPVAISFTDGFDSNTDVIVNEIPLGPNVFPASFTSVLGSRYYIIDAFGSPGSFDVQLTFTVDGAAFHEMAESIPQGVKLYTRPSTSVGSWTFVAGAASVNATTGEVSFDAAVTSFSQFAIVEDESVLPVQMTGLFAEEEEGTIRLNWSTVTEVDNAGWEIERSSSQSTVDSRQTQARVWEKIGFVEGAGTSTTPEEYTFIDSSPITNIQSTRFYRLKQLDRSGAFSYSEVVEFNATSAPRIFFLSQNYPNPFNPSTTVEFTLPADGHATLKAYNMLGQEVASLVNSELRAGVVQRIRWDASGLASGSYFLRLDHAGKQLLKRVLLMK